MRVTQVTILLLKDDDGYFNAYPIGPARYVGKKLLRGKGLRSKDLAMERVNKLFHKNVVEIKYCEP